MLLTQKSSYMGALISFADTLAKLTGDAELQAWGIELEQPVEDGGCGIQVM